MPNSNNLTKIILGEVTEQKPYFYINAINKRNIEAWLNAHFDAIESYSTKNALGLFLTIIQEDFTPEAKNNQLHPIVKDIRRVLDSNLSYEMEKYVHFLTIKKLLQFVVNRDVLANYFVSNFKKNERIEIKIEEILQIMNFLDRAKYFYLGGYNKANVYLEEHGQLLLTLLIDEKLSVQEAIEETINVTPNQALALIALYTNGLRAEHLRTGKYHQPVFFSCEHIYTLVDLIKQKKIAPEVAAAEVKSSQREQLEALRELYPAVKRADLQRWIAGRCAVFGPSQTKALQYLVRKENLSAFYAIREIDELTWECSELLCEFYKKGLRGSHLRDLLHTFRYFDESLATQLASLIEAHPIPEAIKQLKLANKANHYAFFSKPISYEDAIQINPNLVYKQRNG